MLIAFSRPGQFRLRWYLCPKFGAIQNSKQSIGGTSVQDSGSDAVSGGGGGGGGVAVGAALCGAAVCGAAVCGAGAGGSAGFGHDAGGSAGASAGFGNGAEDRMDPKDAERKASMITEPMTNPTMKNERGVKADDEGSGQEHGFSFSPMKGFKGSI